MIIIILTLVSGLLFIYSKIILEIVPVPSLHLSEERILELKGEVYPIITIQGEPALKTATEARTSSNLLIIKLKADG